MSHTNPAYKSDINNRSLGDLPAERRLTSSTGLLDEPLRRTSDHAAIGRHFDPQNLLSATTTDGNTTCAQLSEEHVPIVVDGCPRNVHDESYYSLTNLRRCRRGKRPEDAHLPKRVKQFYKDQDEMIDRYERVYDQSKGVASPDDQSGRTQNMSGILTRVSFGVSICLFVLKIIGAVISRSLSIVSSVVDSAVDLATSTILLWASRKMKQRDKYRYPEGRTRLEPVAIIILSVIMCAASILVIYESVNTIIDDANYFSATDPTKPLAEIDMSAFPVATSVVTIVSKAILFFLCSRVDTLTMSALSVDHRNDVASNTVALICGLIGSFAYRQQINQKAIFIDPIGAILISIYIIIMWIRQATDQTQHLSGYTADPKFLSLITWLTYHHSVLIKKIDTVRAFYFGSSYFVEVDIVLPEQMPLKEAHDIGQSLQEKIEALPEVERAFVHLDYDYDHNPSDEHKVV